MIGTTLAHYRITAKLGAGGMGEVYRANDSKLGRDVALKFLPESFTADPERLARFEREAKLLAQLNHPNIAQIYGLEASGTTLALVMESVPGPTLAERIAAGPLALDECLATARQIAEALEQAHEKGIVHRDLKPQNVKLTDAGRVKVLDFGLAKALDSADGAQLSSSLSISPTITSAGTRMGMILGTAAYMSPEQARGKSVDRRADIWAFGVVLWEMLAGRSLFEGETISDTLAAVLTRDPDWRALPAGTPRALVELLRRLLERDPKRRLHDIADARIVLEDFAAGKLDDAHPAPAPPAPARPRLWVRLAPWVAAAAGLALAAWALSRGERPAATSGVRFAIHAPEGTTIVADQYPSIDVSRDGRSIVFVATDAAGVRRLYLRRLGELEPRALPGTEEARAPFFSPDGRSLGFFSFSALKRVAVDGSGAPIVIAAVENPRGGAWVDDATIAFPVATDSGLFRVSASGGAPAPLTTLDAARNERTHRWPTPLPSGAVLFTSDNHESTEYYDDARIEAVRLDGTRRSVVLEGASFARYLPSGHLLFARGGSLYAVPFDERAFEVRGEPVLVLQEVATGVGSGGVHFGAADVMAWIPGGLSVAIGVVARLGPDGAVATPRVALADEVQQVNLSPDETRLAVVSSAAPNGDVWIIDLARETVSRLSFQANNWDPVWTPDSTAIAYASTRDGGVWRPYLKAADGSTEERLLWKAEQPALPASFSPDGSLLAVEVRSRDAASDIWIVTVDGSAEPYPFVATRNIEWHPCFSPDGRWLAYSANDTGRNEIYVRPFPGPGGVRQVSSEGGHEPRWSPDGSHLYFHYENGLFEVDVDTERGFATSVPRRVLDNNFISNFNHNFDVTADGRVFWAVRAARPSGPAHVAVALDWPAEMRRILGR